jgi:hypothetical protein
MRDAIKGPTVNEGWAFCFYTTLRNTTKSRKVKRAAQALPQRVRRVSAKYFWRLFFVLSGLNIFFHSIQPT